MTLVDKEIQSLLDAGILIDADPKNIGSISCDLRSYHFAQEANDEMEEFTLAPGESVFVACQECVRLPNDLIARIVIRNSRIREGLSLTAPVYQPGHETRLYFRLTNMTEKAIQLTKDSKYASVMFERLASAPNKPYNGTFQKELSFSKMGAYHKEYKIELSEVEEKADNIMHMEKNIYSNVITLMTIFIALFSLINVNVELTYAANIETSRMIVFNLAMIGSIAFLVSVIRLSMSKKKKWEFWVLLVLAILSLVGAVMIAM